MAETNAIRSFNGKTPQMGKRVFIDPTAVVIGDVVLGDDASVWPGVVIRGDIHFIRIGRRTSVQDNSVLHITRANDHNPAGWPLTIGDEVTIGHGACLHGCTVENRVLIGIGAIVLDGAHVPAEVMIGAGAVVTPQKTLESGFLYTGAPARRARALTDDERAFLAYSAVNYVKLKDSYLLQQQPHAPI